MMRATSHIPAGQHTVTPYLVVRGAARAIDFYQKAFGAVEVVRMPGPDGKVLHAEVKIGDSTVMLSDEMEGKCLAPQSLGGSPVRLMVYVPDVDAVFHRAVGAGAKPEMQPEDMFWGDRYGKLVDPFGHGWDLATHKEDLTPQEMQERQEAFFSKMAGPAKA